MQMYPVLFTSLLFLRTILSLAIEPFSISFSSHNITLLNQSPPSNQTNTYRGECAFIDNRPDLPNFHEDSCTLAIPIACSKITYATPRYLVKDRWIWTNLPGCSLAYYLPMAAPPVFIPTKQECEVQIYEYLVQKCVGSPLVNLGTINVLSPPSPRGPGMPFNKDLPRYLVSPKQLDIRAAPV